jgi:subtilisin family serine protease
MAAGVAALAKSHKPSLTPTALEQLMRSKADPKGATGKDDYFGYGRVNAYKVINAI